MHWTAIRTPQRVILAHTLGDHSPEEAAQAVDDAGLNSEGGRLIQLTNEEASMLAPWVSMRTTFSRGRVQVGETDQDGARRLFDAIEDQRELRRFHSAGHAPSFALVRFDAEHPAGWVIDPVMPADLEGHLARAVDVEEQDFHAEARDLLRGRLVTIDGMTFVYRLSRPGADVKDVMRDAMEQTNRQIVDELRQALSDAGETLARVTAERDDLKAKVAEATAVFDDMRRDIRNLRSERDEARQERDEARESRDGCKAAWKRDVAQMRQAHDDFVSAVRTDEKEAHGFLLARGFDGATALDSAQAAVDLYADATAQLNKLEVNHEAVVATKRNYEKTCEECHALLDAATEGQQRPASLVERVKALIAERDSIAELADAARDFMERDGEANTKALTSLRAQNSHIREIAATPITAAMVGRLKSELDEAKAKCEAAREYGHKLTDAIAAAGVAADLDISGDPEETLRMLASEVQTLGERVEVAESSALKAPTILLLRRDSPRIMWAVVLGRTIQKVREAVRADKVSHWQTNEWGVQKAVLLAAIALEVGEMRQLDDSCPTRVVGGCCYGANAQAIITPYGGSIDSFLSALWAKAGGCLSATMDHDEYVLTPSPVKAHPPSERAKAIAADCKALRDAGSRVGVLIDGPPGTGKSEALRYVASELGGRTLRATLNKDSRAHVASFARHLRPDVVIIDDIDRMETEHALDAVDQILATGAAVLTTSNDRSKVCDALLRSGRVDLHHEFAGCEPDVFARLTAGLSPEQIELLGGQTVATIVRHNELAATLGEAKAAAYVRSLSREA